MTKHICIATSAHPRDDVRLYEKLARSLLANGYRVSWVGPNISYVDGSALDARIEYHLFTPPRSRLSRLFSNCLSDKLSKLDRPDVLIAAEPDSALAASRYRGKSAVRVVFDIHELYHKAHVKAWAPRWLHGPAAKLVVQYLRSVCRRCDLVIGVSDGVLEPYNVVAKQSMILRNCAGRGYAEGHERKTSRNPRSFVVMHGKATEYNGTSHVLAAASIAKEQIPGLKILMFDWTGVDATNSRGALINKINELGLERVVELHSPIAPSKMPGLLSNCDAGMIGHGRMLAAGTQPNRAYEYMACALPLLVPSYDAGIGAIVRENECGLLIDFENAADIANGLVRLYQDNGLRSRLANNSVQMFQLKYNWDVEVQPLLYWIDEIKYEHEMSRSSSVKAVA